MIFSDRSRISTSKSHVGAVAACPHAKLAATAPDGDEVCYVYIM